MGYLRSPLIAVPCDPERWPLKVLVHKMNRAAVPGDPWLLGLAIHMVVVTPVVGQLLTHPKGLPNFSALGAPPFTQDTLFGSNCGGCLCIYEGVNSTKVLALCVILLFFTEGVDLTRAPWPAFGVGAAPQKYIPKVWRVVETFAGCGNLTREVKACCYPAISLEKQFGGNFNDFLGASGFACLSKNKSRVGLYIGRAWLWL